MAEVSENFKFVDDLQQALRESLALFRLANQNLNKNRREHCGKERFFRTVTDGVCTAQINHTSL